MPNQNPEPQEESSASGTFLLQQERKPTQPNNTDLMAKALNTREQLEEVLLLYLHSARVIQDKAEGRTLKDEKGNIVSRQTVSKGRWRYQHLPTEERIISCADLGINCDYALKHDDEPAHYQRPEDEAELRTTIAYTIVFDDTNPENKLTDMSTHIKAAHRTNVSAAELKQIAKWLTWKPKMNMAGVNSIRSAILANTVESNMVGRIVKGEMDIKETVKEISRSIVMDAILNHREYEFDIGNGAAVKQLTALTANIIFNAMNKNLDGFMAKLLTESHEVKELRNDMPYAPQMPPQKKNFWNNVKLH